MMTNKKPGRCECCQGWVLPGKGTITQNANGDWKLLKHADIAECKAIVAEREANHALVERGY